MSGDPRGLPLGARDCKGISHENPFAQAERPTKKLGTTKQACDDFKYNRLFKPISHHQPQAERPTKNRGKTKQACDAYNKTTSSNPINSSPHPQAERPTKKLGTTKQACDDLKNSRHSYSSSLALPLYLCILLPQP